MVLTIEMPPQMAQEIRGYAILDGESVEKLCLDYIAREIQRRRETKAIMDEFKSLAERTSRRRSKPYVFNRADAYEETFVNVFSRMRVVPVETTWTNRALEIKDQYGTQFFDSLLLAAAEAHGCDTILSEDLNDGQVYAGVKAVNPFK